MSPAIAGVLVIVGLVSAAAAVVGIPLFIGVIAYDVYQQRKQPKVRVAEDTELRIAVERGIARAFVILGGAFWSVATFAGLHAFRETGMGSSLMAAFIPAVACLATLIVGWYYERVTAVALLVASLAVIAWGVIYQFEMGVWMLMTLALIGPMMTASVLFWLARRDQEAFERVALTRPQLAMVFAARSSLGR